MLFYTPLPLLFIVITLITAQRPPQIPICDYYAAKILGNNTAITEKLLITILVNTFVLGNYSKPNIGITVAGIAAPAVYNQTSINLLPYFTGAYNSTNEGGSMGVSKVFLDDGGAKPLTMNMSSNGNVGSAQYHLLTDIYQYFATLLGCSKQGGKEFPSYQGRTSMYEVHKYMNLDIFQMDFFIVQCTTAARAIGFDNQDAIIFGNILNTLFNTRCAPPTAIPGISAPGPELQSSCIAANCPLDPHGNCSIYPNKGLALIPTNVSTQVVGGQNGNGSANATVPATGSAGRNEDLFTLIATIILTVLLCSV